MSRRTAFVLCLLASLAAFAQEPATAQPSAGYIITPSGTIIFPDAPPPAGDTSTLSGAGPSVSTGPVVGPGPEVSTGPVVGPSVYDQFAELRRQLAAEESRRRYERAEEAAQHAATLEALDTLRRAEASLATGDSDGVDDELLRAEAALSGRTRLDVEAAREALGRSDLAPARGFLAAALAENRVRP